MHRVYISIGSNIEPVENVARASRSLERMLDSFDSSPVYRSKAIGLDGPDFLNSVVTGYTAASITDFNQQLSDIEAAQGRTRSGDRFSSRTLDLDLLLYDSVEWNADGLVLPRPEILDAVFVLQPLADIAPKVNHPVLGASYSELLDQLFDAQPAQRHLLTRVSQSLPPSD